MENLSSRVSWQVCIFIDFKPLFFVLFVLVLYLFVSFTIYYIFFFKIVPLYLIENGIMPDFRDIQGNHHTKAFQFKCIFFFIHDKDKIELDEKETQRKYNILPQNG